MVKTGGFRGGKGQTWKIGPKIQIEHEVIQLKLCSFQYLE